MNTRANMVSMRDMVATEKGDGVAGPGNPEIRLVRVPCASVQIPISFGLGNLMTG